MKKQKELHDFLAYAGKDGQRLSAMDYIQQKVDTTSPTEIMAIVIDALAELEARLLAPTNPPEAVLAQTNGDAPPTEESVLRPVPEAVQVKARGWPKGKKRK